MRTDNELHLIRLYLLWPHMWVKHVLRKLFCSIDFYHPFFSIFPRICVHGYHFACRRLHVSSCSEFLSIRGEILTRNLHFWLPNSGSLTFIHINYYTLNIIKQCHYTYLFYFLLLNSSFSKSMFIHCYLRIDNSLK